MQARPTKLQPPIYAHIDEHPNIFRYQIGNLIFGETVHGTQTYFDAHQVLKNSGHIGGFLTDIVERNVKKNKLLLLSQAVPNADFAGLARWRDTNHMSFKNNVQTNYQQLVILTSGRPEYLKQYPYYLGHEYTHFLGGILNPNTLGDPFKSTAQQNELVRAWKNTFEKFIVNENHYQQQLGNKACHDLRRYLFDYPVHATHKIDLATTKPQTFRSEIFATQLEYELKHPGLGRTPIADEVSHLLYNGMFSVPGLNDFNITANRANSVGLSQFPHTANTKFYLDNIRNPIKVPVRTPLLLGYTPRPTTTLYSYVKSYVPTAFKVFGIVTTPMSYNSYLQAEYQLDPTGPWFQRGTTKFGVDTLLYSTAFATIGYSFVPIMLLDGIHDHTQQLHYANCNRFSHIDNQPNQKHSFSQAVSHAISVDENFDRMIDSGSALALTYTGRWLMDGFRNASNSISNIILDSGVIDRTRDVINACSEDLSKDDDAYYPIFKRDSQHPPVTDQSDARKEITAPIPIYWITEENEDKKPYAVTQYDLNTWSPVDLSTKSTPSAAAAANSENTSDVSAALPPAATNAETTTEASKKSPQPQYVYCPAPPPETTPFTDNFKVKNRWIGPMHGGGVGINFELENSAIIGIGIAAGGIGGGVKSGLIVSLSVPLEEGFSAAFLSGAAIGLLAVGLIATAQYFYQRYQKHIARKSKHAAERTINNSHEIIELFNGLHEDLKNGVITPHEFNALLQDIVTIIDAEHLKINKREDYAWRFERHSAVYVHQSFDWQLNNVKAHIVQQQSLTKLKETVLQDIKSEILSTKNITDRIKSFCDKKTLTIKETFELDYLISMVASRANTEGLSLDELEGIQNLSSAEIRAAQIIPDPILLAPLHRDCFDGHSGRHKVYSMEAMNLLVAAYKIVQEVAAGTRTDMTLDEAVNNYNKIENKTIKKLNTYPLKKDGSAITNAGQYFEPHISSLRTSVNSLNLTPAQPALSTQFIRYLSTTTYLQECNKQTELLKTIDPDDTVALQAAFDLRYKTVLKIIELALNNNELGFEDKVVTSDDKNSPSDLDNFNLYCRSVVNNYDICNGKHYLLIGLEKFWTLMSLEAALKDEKNDSAIKDSAFKDRYTICAKLSALLITHPEFLTVINKSISYLNSELNSAEERTAESNDTSLTTDIDASHNEDKYSLQQFELYLSACVKSFELADGSYSLFTDISQLQQFMQAGNTNDAYKLAKKIKLVATHSELKEICHQAIIRSYELSRAVLSPIADVGMYVLSNQASKYGSSKLIATIQGVEKFHHLFSSPLRNMASCIPYIFYNDLDECWKKGIDQLNAEIRDYATLPANFNAAHRQLNLIQTACQLAYEHSAQLSQPIIALLSWLGIDCPKIYINNLEPKLTFISEKFGALVTEVESKTVSALTHLGASDNVHHYFKFKHLPKVSTLTGLLAAIETCYRYMSAFNLTTSEHAYFVDIVINHAIKALEWQYFPPGKRSENVNYYRSLDLIKAASALVILSQLSYPAISYAVEKILICAYNSSTGNYRESVITAKIDNIYHLLKDSDKCTDQHYTLAAEKLVELEKEIVSLSQSKHYQEADSHTLKFARKFHLDIQCHLLLHSHQYDKVLTLTKVTPDIKNMHYHYMKIPVTYPATPLLSYFEALLITQPTTPAAWYSEYNHLANCISDDSTRQTLAKKIVHRHINLLVSNTLSAKGVKQVAAVNEYQQLSLIHISSKNDLLTQHTIECLDYVTHPTQLNYLRMLCTIPVDQLTTDVSDAIKSVVQYINGVVPHIITTDVTLDIDKLDTLDKLLYEKLNHAANNKNVRLLQDLLALGAGQSRRYNLSSIFINAAKNGYLQILELLLPYQHGAEVNITINSMTALHHAAAQSDTTSIQCLGKHGANLDLQNHEGETALHLAIRHGHMEAVKTLLWLGAARNISNKNSKTPRKLATFLNKTEIANIIKYHGKHYSNPTEINYLSKLCTLPQHLVTSQVMHSVGSIVTLIYTVIPYQLPINSLFDLQTLDKLTQQLKLEVNNAAGSGDYLKLKTLFKLGVPHFKFFDPSDVLIEAVRNGNDHMVPLLLKHGARVDYSIDHMTALHYAAMRGKTETIQRLAKRSEDIDLLVNRQNSKGETALHLAVRHQHTDAVKMLLSFGAKEDIYDNQHQTALTLSKEMNNDVTTKLLTNNYNGVGLFSASAAAVNACIAPNELGRRRPFKI